MHIMKMNYKKYFKIYIKYIGNIFYNKSLINLLMKNHLYTVIYTYIYI
jgi:hypothetical protein